MKQSLRRATDRPAETHCLVARWLSSTGSRPHFRFHIDEDTYVDDLTEALDALKEA